ncbi:MAG: hypothetical protein ACRC3I_02485 [Cetobacterium sp.]
MGRGGKRSNSGRKKIGDKQVKIVLNEKTLLDINEKFNGKTNAEKVRKCILKGLERDDDGEYTL